MRRETQALRSTVRLFETDDVLDSVVGVVLASVTIWVSWREAAGDLEVRRSRPDDGGSTP